MRFFFVLFIVHFFFYHFMWIDQTIPSMSQMMKSLNRNQKQIIKTLQYCRCQILCLLHRCTIIHKKRFTKQAHVFYSWLLNGLKIYQVLLSLHSVIRWANFLTSCFFLFFFFFETKLIFIIFNQSIRKSCCSYEK